MTTIKLGDPQPHSCPKCGGMHGYQVGDNVRRVYYYRYDSDGENDGGFWTDSTKTTSKGKRAECSNCSSDLKIKIDREND